MTKISNQTYNFLFHPLHPKHSGLTRSASIVTLIALSILSLGIFAIIFAVKQWEDRKVTPESKTNFSCNLDINPSDPIITPSISLKLQDLKNQHFQQLEQFEKWARQDDWGQIKSAHYDWWMFPVNRDSSGYGSKYNVSKSEVEILKKDPEFMRNYLQGVILVVKGWGWDLTQDQAIREPQKNQGWNGYGVRLAKMSDSLQLFGQKEMHQKLKHFFLMHCLPLQNQIPISDFKWLQKSFSL